MPSSAEESGLCSSICMSAMVMEMVWLLLMYVHIVFFFESDIADIGHRAGHGSGFG